MKTMTRPIQTRIHERRQEFGASIDQVAEWSGIDAARWRAIEEGEPLSVAELGRVARALAVDAGTLIRGEESSPRRSVARFRQAVPIDGGPSVVETRMLALAAELGRIAGGLCRLLGKSLPLAELRETQPVSSTEEPWKQGYRLGEAARGKLGIPLGPVMDLRTSLETAGIHVAMVPFSRPEIDAASLMEPGSVPIVLLNQLSPRIGRALSRRAAMAHELCHLLHDAGEHDLETQMSRSEAPGIDDAVEQRARAFAPAFLAPRDEVRHWFERGGGRRTRRADSKVLALAKRWGLSWGGAIWHAKNCGLISPRQADELNSSRHSAPVRDWEADFETAAATEVTRSVGDVVPIPLCAGKIAEWVGEAVDAGAISEGRAREILTWG